MTQILKDGNGVPYYVDTNGTERKLALLDTEEDDFVSSPKFDEQFTVYEETDLQEVDFFHFNPEVVDQGKFGSCGGQAGVDALEIIWNKTYGSPPPQPLSRTYPYAMINEGKDSGCRLRDILAALHNYGTCFRTQMPQHSVMPQQITDEAKKTAERFHLAIAFRCFTYQHLLSAIHLGMPVVLGLKIGFNFDQLDEDGVIPLPDYDIGGHAMVGAGLKKHPEHGWMIHVKNTYGKLWGGHGGYAYVHAGHFTDKIDAFAAAAPADDPEVKELPAVSIPFTALPEGQYLKSPVTPLREGLMEKVEEDLASAPEEQTELDRAVPTDKPVRVVDAEEEEKTTPPDPVTTPLLQQLNEEETQPEDQLKDVKDEPTPETEMSAVSEPESEESQTEETPASESEPEEPQVEEPPVEELEDDLRPEYDLNELTRTPAGRRQSQEATSEEKPETEEEEGGTATPSELKKQADDITATLLGLSDAECEIELGKLAGQNATIHALVKDRIEKAKG